MGNRRTFIQLAVTLVLAVMVTAGGAHALLGFGKYQKVKVANGVVAIPLAVLNDGKAHFFKFEDGGKEIAFFLVKAADGTVRSAFDACDACFREKKGYEQQGDKMRCRNCNMKFAIERIGPHAIGGCNPSYLPHKVVNGSIAIGVEDLKAGARFF